jgi:hypothetical protein
MNKKLIIIFIIIVVIILAGITLGFFYSSLPENNPQRDKKSCESIYGKWLDDENKCLLSYKKAGETCIDGGQCKSGVCFPLELTEEQNIILETESIKGIKGTCYPENRVFGCVKQVINGTISKKSMCLEN